MHIQSPECFDNLYFFLTSSRLLMVEIDITDCADSPLRIDKVTAAIIAGVPVTPSSWIGRGP